MIAWNFPPIVLTLVESCTSMRLMTTSTLLVTCLLAFLSKNHLPLLCSARLSCKMFVASCGLIELMILKTVYFLLASTFQWIYGGLLTHLLSIMVCWMLLDLVQELNAISHPMILDSTKVTTSFLLQINALSTFIPMVLFLGFIMKQDPNYSIQVW